MLQAGLQCHIPLAHERTCLMHGIYQGVKAGYMAMRHQLGTLLMGCTEIPLALTDVPHMAGLNLVDPANLLARALAQGAYSPA